ncbi:hypothetical protein [Streptomyces tricolor]|uniref:hypothetical protein n=1 Tax=Streptomyces tricolor TaxID=68277 RepID=UPI0036EF8FFD
MPPPEYVERARLAVVARRPRETPRSAARLAREAGFGTEATTGRAIARVLGVSPPGHRERFS